MRQVAFADCETDPFKYGEEVKPFVWVFRVMGQQSEVFFSTTEFLNRVEEFDGIVYAHNGGKFDWMFNEVIDRFDNDQKIMIINNRIAKVKIGKAELRDSFLCLPASLAKFGKMDFDYSLMEKGKREGHMSEIVKYCESDVVNLEKMMTLFIEQHGTALTQAGAAMKTWEKMGGTKRRYGPLHDMKFRPWYHGGRTEVIKYLNGEQGPWYYYDITSSYPDGMCKDHCVGTKFMKTRNYNETCGSSFWKVRAISKGALLFKDKKGRVSFPRDNTVREYYTTGWELTAAIETDSIDIIDAVGYEPANFETYKPYVERFMKEKDEATIAGDKMRREIAKMFLNSLYGRNGMNGADYFDYHIIEKGINPNPPEHYEMKGVKLWHPWQVLDNMTIWRRPTMEPTFIDVAVAASITGEARAKLWRGLHAVIEPVYCDTDSIICREPGTLNLGDKLGEFKLETVADRMWIAGKKLYALEISDGYYEKLPPSERDEYYGYKTVSKGLSMAPGKKMFPKDIMRVCAGEKVKVYRDAPTLKLDGRQEFITRTARMT